MVGVLVSRLAYLQQNNTWSARIRPVLGARKRLSLDRVPSTKTSNVSSPLCRGSDSQGPGHLSPLAAPDPDFPSPLCPAPGWWLFLHPPAFICSTPLMGVRRAESPPEPWPEGRESMDINSGISAHTCIHTYI